MDETAWTPRVLSRHPSLYFLDGDVCLLVSRRTDVVLLRVHTIVLLGKKCNIVTHRDLPLLRYEDLPVVYTDVPHVVVEAELSARYRRHQTYM